jgi:hypothetical protein
MSTFTRTTTPPFSANPFQKFVTLKQARRAAKGAAVVAGAQVLTALISIPALYAGAYSVVSPAADARRTVAVTSFLILGAIMALLSVLIWRKPGPIKVSLILAYCVLNAVDQVVQFISLFGVIFGIIYLNFAVIALRGALAAKRLQSQAEAASS